MNARNEWTKNEKKLYYNEIVTNATYLPRIQSISIQYAFAVIYFYIKVLYFSSSMVAFGAPFLVSENSFPKSKNRNGIDAVDT